MSTTATYAALTGTAVTAALAALTSTASASPAQGWGPIIACESGGSATAQNPTSTASGLYQMLDSTWQGLGGSGRAKDAPVAEQTRLADKLFAQAGTSPWASSQGCWGGKTGAVTAAPKVEPAAKAPHGKPAAPVTTQARATVKAIAPVPAQKPARTARHASGLDAPDIPTGAPRHAVTTAAGDTLSGIAQINGLDWRTIYTHNRAVIGDNPDLLFPGQVLAL